MLHLLSFIWFCLLLAALAGFLLARWWLGHKNSSSKVDTDGKLQKDFETTKRTLLERDKELETLKIERDKQLEAMKAELATAKTERDRVRTESIPLNTRIDELTRNLSDSEKLRLAAEEKMKLAGTGPKTLGELDAIGAERDQLKISLAKAREQLQVHTQALTQANANIQTANHTIQTAQAQLQVQETRLQEQAAELTNLRAGPAALGVSSIGGLTIAAAETGRQDDLKEIVGIGPFIESKLHALGIHTFKQIALLSPEMLDKVAENIEYFQGRIGRENWTEQCKALHFDKYGEKL